MKVLGVIPARGGSKRVKDKNIRLLSGKPLIGYTIEAANESSLISSCVVSTDSEIIMNVAKDLGANVPFKRPESLAEDKTPDRPVLQHAVQWYVDEFGESPDAVLILRPTTPFKTAKHIDTIIEKLSSSNFDSIRSMTAVESIHHPYWMYTADENQNASSFVDNISTDTFFQSQSLPPVYRLNGVVDIIRTEVLMNDDLPLYGDNMGMYELPEEVAMDIDTELDFKMCELLMQE